MDDSLTKAPHTLLLINKILSFREKDHNNDEIIRNRPLRVDTSAPPSSSPPDTEKYEYSSDESNLIMSPLFDSPSIFSNNSYNYDADEEDESFAPPDKKSLEVWDRFFQNAAIQSFPEAYDTATIVDDSNNENAQNNIPDIIVTGHHGQRNIPDIIIDTGNSPLHLACINFDLKAITSLLEQGASIDVRNENNQTPLGICFANGFLKGRNKLMEHRDSFRETEDNDSVNKVYGYSDDDSLLLVFFYWLWRYFLSLFRPLTEKVKQH